MPLAVRGGGFAEKVVDPTTRYAIAGLGAKLRWGARALAPTGRARLLGLLHAPPVSAPSPGMLGIDDFAFRARADRTGGSC
ncbi:hypothetical protein [Streptomyces jeddahensis]|uniref:Uncharacterized protein n=1 Tax=Streptomyces jeddahensis TaxID=1716141 RepID=A0A177HI84_9ACTN|nr:hypothetical protein [Streptomyces jeddahensis]OAH10309.1 hypothetical protein STSP_63790 [Streptomyces jeddahensis]